MCNNPVDSTDSSYVIPDNAVVILYSALLPFSIVTFLTYAMYFARSDINEFRNGIHLFPHNYHNILVNRTE